MEKASVTMKLLIDTKGKRVLFAEAGKDCVDFLFYILSLPVATIIRLLKEQGMEGSLPNIYQSLENLNETYIQSSHDKESFLESMMPVASFSVPLLCLNNASNKKEFYRCCHCHNSISDGVGANCIHCRHDIDDKVVYVKPPRVEVSSSGDGGLVKGVVTYMVMDNLEVKPMSTISSLTLLNKFNVKDVGALEEKVVNVGMNEAIKLLKISLQSKKVLTEVFCGQVTTREIRAALQI